MMKDNGMMQESAGLMGRQTNQTPANEGGAKHEGWKTEAIRLRKAKGGYIGTCELRKEIPATKDRPYPGSDYKSEDYVFRTPDELAAFAMDHLDDGDMVAGTGGQSAVPSRY